MAELEPNDATITFFEIIALMNKSYPDFTNPAQVINTMTLGQVLKLLHASLEFGLGVMLGESENTGKTVEWILNEWRERYIEAVLNSDV